MRIANPSNCWNTLKPLKPQRKNEMSNRDGSESRKNLVDGIRSKPKYLNNGQSAAKPRTEEGSETIPIGSRGASDWRFEVVGSQAADDIVRSSGKSGSHMGLP